MPLKKTVRNVLRRLGYDLHRHHPSVSPSAQLGSILNFLEIDLVLDVGANEGQFGQQLRELGYRGQIFSFEPLSEPRQKLLAASRNDRLWDVAEQAALGDVAGEIEIHISANSVSSSALQMLPAHIRSAPDSGFVGVERVPIKRLDDLTESVLAKRKNAFLKIDTQGYEDRVLNGASVTLGRLAAVQLELSLVPLYKDQLLYREMIERMSTLGFEMWAAWPAFVDPESGRSLQLDATFVRCGHG